jgi:hypothetical protein
LQIKFTSDLFVLPSLYCPQCTALIVLRSDTVAGPVLGGAELPYPRHLRTNRPLNPKTGQEAQPPQGARAWCPYDEIFDYTRSVWTTGNAVAFEQQAEIQLKVVSQGLGGEVGIRV